MNKVNKINNLNNLNEYINNLNEYINRCSNKLCNIKYRNPIYFCYECGSKSTNPKNTINGKLILKRMTHLYCSNCLSCLQSYDDKFCRDCGIRLLYNNKI